LIEAQGESEFGGKAVHLATALRAGLDVPTGYALSFEWVEAVTRNDATILTQLKAAFAQMHTPIAVRSSAAGEDSAAASFAGQHATILNVMTFSQLTSAIAEVVQSALSPSATSYREKLGVVGAPSMGVVLQELFNPESAGVMFTRNPLNGVEERVIEAAWGLGEVVVAGLVIPDYYRISPTGEILERRVGDKDIALRLLAEGGTEEIEVPADKANTRILDDDDLQNLHHLALQCESVYGKDLDMEWGLADGRLVLLQCRAITTRP
jgi:pyruvate,water dikinase